MIHYVYVQSFILLVGFNLLEIIILVFTIWFTGTFERRKE